MQLSANKTTRKTGQPAINWDWLAVAMLLAAILLASLRFVVTRATDNLILVSFLALIGCIAGLALGHSRFPFWLSSIFGALYGMFFIPWQIGLAFFPELSWVERLNGLFGRLSFAVNQFFAGENVKDPLLFLMCMTTIFWLLGLSSGFRFARHGDPWGSLIPLGLVSLTVQIYDSGASWKAWLIALLLFCLLSLLSRLRYLREYERWELQRVHIPLELNNGLTMLAFASAGLLVLLAWATPALASSLSSAESFWSTITSPWRAIRDELSRALFSLKGESFRVGISFGTQYALGRGIPQSPSVVFSVQILQQDQVPLRYYWRDRVYDHYENGIWTSDYDGLEAWDNSKTDSLTGLEGRTTAQFLFTVQNNLALLHSAAQPTSLDRPARYSFAANEDGSQDVAALFANSPLLPGESYELTSSLDVPTANLLEGARKEYPDWITARYLQLPRNFSPRLQELAKTLTTNLATPYDETLAITNYLRSALDYVELMPRAPNDRDPIEWAVFVQKQGFCNYYASAEVLMLRSLGIPARLAVGYVHGERESLGGRVTYTIRQRDAHAWPEVFFPGIGWVEFEPTANQDPLIRPVETAEEAISLEEEQRLLRLGLQNESLEPGVQTPEALSSDQYLAQVEASYFLPSMLFMAALGLAFAALLWRRYRHQGGLPLAALAVRGLSRLNVQPPQTLKRMAYLAEMPALTRAYMQINLALNWIGQPAKPGTSPEERATALAKRLPKLSEEIHTVSNDYQRKLYGISKVTRGERAVRIQRRLWWAARSEQLSSWIQGIIATIRK